MLVSFRGADRQILLPLDRGQATLFPLVSSLCAKLS